MHHLVDQAVKIALFISTIDRAPKANYLGATLDSMSRGGVWSSVIPFVLTIVDSGSVDPQKHYRQEVEGRIPSDVSVVFDIVPGGGRRTHNENANRAAILAHILDADWTLFCEDDIRVCSKFLESAVCWLNEHFDPRWLLYVLGSPYKQVLTEFQRGKTFWEYPIETFYGSQCVAVHRMHLAHMTRWLLRHPLYRGTVSVSHDLNLADWARERSPSEKYFLASAPSMVDHVGVESFIGNRAFSFPSFQGENWTYVS